MAAKKKTAPKRALDPRIQRIAEHIKELRTKTGDTYEDFAYEHDFSRMQYWRLENGISDMRLQTLFHVVDAHGMKLKDFFAAIDI